MISSAAGILRHYLPPSVLLTAALAGWLCWSLCGFAEQRGRLLRKQRAALAVLCAYLILSLSIVILLRRIKPGSHVNLRLFWSYRAIARGRLNLLYLDIFNVLLFVPFGLLWPVADRKPGFRRTVAFGACLSLAGELLQAVSARGLFELDDLFHNVVGTALGAALWLWISRRRSKSAEAGPKAEPRGEKDPAEAPPPREPGRSLPGEAEKTGAVGSGGKESTMNLANTGSSDGRAREKAACPGAGDPLFPDQTGTEGMSAKDLELFLTLLRAGILGETPELGPFEGHWEDVHPRQILSLAQRHDVVLTVYAALNKTEEPTLLRLKTELRPIYAPMFAKAVNQDCEGKLVLDALEQAGLDYIPLKGWVQREMYADPLTRSMSDLDILFPDYRYREIREVMESLGYQSYARSAWKHDTYRKKPYMAVEMHKRLTDDSGAIRAWEHRIPARCIRASETGHRLDMSPEDFYLFHLVHMYRGFLCGTLGFRRLADLWLLMHRGPELNRELIRSELSSMDLLSYAERMERLADVCFEGREADEESRILLRYALEGGVFTDEQRYKLSRMASMPGDSARRAKLRSVLRAVFLPYRRMKAQYPIVEKHPVLLPWFWLKRILRYAKRPAAKLKRLNYRGLTDSQYEDMRRVFRAGGVLPDEENR